MIRIFIENTILLYLEFLALYFLTLGLLQKIKVKKVQSIFMSIALVLTNGLLETFMQNEMIALIIGHSLTIIFFYYITKESFLHIIYIYAFDYIFVALCSIILFAIFPLNGAIIFQGIVPYIGSSIILFLAYLAYLLLPLNRLYALLLHHNTTVLLILVNTLLISIGLILYARFDSQDFFSHYLLIFIFTLGLIFINGEVFLNHQKRIQEKKQLDTYQAYLPIVENLIGQVRSKQHDYHNHLQNIRGLCYTATDFESLRQELLETTDYYSKTSDLSQLLMLNLHLLAGFLISKSEEAHKASKLLEITIHQPFLTTDCNEYELVEYIGILIDNALEATPSNGIIYADIGMEQNTLLFSIKNPGPIATPDYCKKIFHSGYTSKRRHSSEHGIGLHKLLAFVKANNGELIVSNETLHDTTYINFQLKISSSQR